MHNTGITITPRTTSNAYNVRLNQTTFDILSFLFEFKLLGVRELTRVLQPKRNTKYIYRKLGQMKSAGLIETHQMPRATSFGTPVYYMLEKRGLKLLEEHGKYSRFEIAKYPKTTALLRLDTFAHDIQVGELASLEAINATESLHISMKGEAASLAYDWRSDSNIEVFTPDYTALYEKDGNCITIYTEFERTPKSKQALFRKIKRYLLHLESEARKNCILRFIFQTPAMERNFWLTMVIEGSQYVQSLSLATTNMTLLSDHAQFMSPIYSTDDSMRLVRRGRVEAVLSRRVKLLPWI